LNLKKIFQKKEVQDYIIKLNSFEQLFLKGIDIQGREVGKYSINTERFLDSLPINRSVFSFYGVTKRKNAGDNFFFYDTGEFFKDMKVKLENDGFIISSDTDTADKLEEKYGNRLIGLTNESKKKLGQFILQNIRQDIL
jgi:hypothetical protein